LAAGKLLGFLGRIFIAGLGDLAAAAAEKEEINDHRDDK
jgi:hypothetical protein